ncbi:Aldolase vrtJ [Erysiphe neolycopersici]|uniref:Aldolase vrtJ n=1 Tax=Erysiphe neolycopersici TaxID=212602 RepID=A0A420HPX0_9PEZI|nr:Aldolase vrtJ [Erysiphe neolycopersici]
MLAQDMDRNRNLNAWCHPGPAAFDFRSDVVTSPTASMLEAIKNTTLLDDVFQADPTTNDLETHLAARTSHQAALFVLSGTMGNQLALRSHLQQPPYAVLCDNRGHIFEWEAGGVATLCGALIKSVIPSNGEYLTLEDIEKNVVLGDEIHSTPTRVISLENTLGGIIMPLSETKRISKFAREYGIKIHLDGARLWEAVAAGAGSLIDYCELFDSVSLCFSKGLGAPVGSILVGEEAFIKHARWMRKSIGGGIRQSGVLTSAARVALDETFGSGPWGDGGKLKASHLVAKKIAKAWTSRGGRLLRRTETNMVWLNLEASNVNDDTFINIAKENELQVSGPRLVVHYQISEEAVDKLERVFERILLTSTPNETIKRSIGTRVYGVV